MASTHSIAVVDVGLMRAMVHEPDDDHWNADALRRLAIHNACLVARNVVAAGLSVVIADDVSEETAPLYRTLLADLGPRIVHLAPVANPATSHDGLSGDVPPGPSRSSAAGARLGDDALDSAQLTASELATALAELVARRETSRPADW
jgi:hypothetical protein